MLEAIDFGIIITQKRGCIIYVAKTKALISCIVTTQLTCAFLFAYANTEFLMALLYLTFTSGLGFLVHKTYRSNEAENSENYFYSSGHVALIQHEDEERSHMINCENH